MALPRKERTKQFLVGNKAEGADFSKEEIELLIRDVALWFQSPKCDRSYDDPLEMARQQVQECLLAETREGKPWHNAPNDFKVRVRVKCLYDMESGEGIRIDRTTKKKRGRHPMARDTKEGAEAAAKSINRHAVIKANFDAKKFRDKAEKDVYKTFPELDNVVHRQNVKRLSLLYAEQEKIDMELEMVANGGQKEAALKALGEIEKQINVTMNMLGIHPNQLRKNMDKHRDGSLGDLVAHLDGDDEFKDREKLWAKQAAYQLWYMSQHPNGRGDGPQLEPWEVWHLTRTRPIDYTCQCGKRVTLVEGFEPDDLRDYLLRNGMELLTPAVPGFIRPKDLWNIGKENVDGEAISGTDAERGSSDQVNSEESGVEREG